MLQATYNLGRSRSRSRTGKLVLLIILLTYAAGAIAQGPTNTTTTLTNTTPDTQPADRSAAGDVLLYGTGSWGTLVNLFFLLSALFTDILIIRVWLVLAYVFLAVNTILNFPDILVWHGNASPHKLILGTLCWTVITLALQLWALVILVWDELPVRLSGDDELLWRMFHRRCGMTRKEFQHVLALGTWQQFKAGEAIERRDKDEPRMFVIFKGRCSLASRQPDVPPIPLASGQVANLYLFNLFGIYVGFEQDPDEKPLMLAETDVVLFSWTISALLKISSGEVSIALPGYFRSLALYLIGFEFCKLHLGMQPYSSNGQPEPDPAAWARGEVMCRDFVAPLGPDEENKMRIWSAILSMLRSFKLTVPRGLRHAANPKTGAMASSRVVLASHMRQRRQQLPAALAQSRPVLEAEGGVRRSAMLSRLNTIGSTVSSTAGSGVNVMLGKRRSSSLPSRRQNDQSAMC